jgi:hypothetical protein
MLICHRFYHLINYQLRSSHQTAKLIIVSIKTIPTPFHSHLRTILKEKESIRQMVRAKTLNRLLNPMVRPLSQTEKAIKTSASTCKPLNH